VLPEELLPLSYTISSTSKHDKVAVILWLYHIDLWKEFYQLLKPINNDIVLYLGLPTEASWFYDSIKQDIADFNHNIHYNPNYGCDVAPFLNQLHYISEPTFIKLHSKKSSWGVKRNIPWRSVLLHDLIGSKEIFDKNRIIINNDDAGAVCNKLLLLKDRELTNTKIIKKICKLINIKYSHVAKSEFSAGNMFWSKTDIYKKYFKKEICEKLLNSLQKEKGKITDEYYGTYSHSLERVFGYIIKQEEKKFLYPNHKAIKILNKQAENGYYNLVITYDKCCYLEEDLNAFGHIIKLSKKNMLIQWLHMPTIIYQNYRILDNNTIIKDDNAKTNIIS